MIPVTTMAAARAQANPVVSRFKAKGATEPGRAIKWAPGDKTQKREFDGLVARGALVEMRPGHYYLNLEKLAAPGARQAVLVVLALALTLLLAGMLLLLRMV